MTETLNNYCPHCIFSYMKLCIIEFSPSKGAKSFVDNGERPEDRHTQKFCSHCTSSSM